MSATDERFGQGYSDNKELRGARFYAAQSSNKIKNSPDSQQEPSVEATPSSLEVASGALEFPNGSYEGQLEGGMPHGNGSRIWSNGDKYVGDWQNGKRHGKGSFTWGGANYVGEWSDDLKHGKGTWTRGDGSVVFTGRWAKGKQA